jgi:hypothetical protein
VGSLRQIQREAKLESQQSLLFSFEQLGISCTTQVSKTNQELLWLEKGCQQLQVCVDTAKKMYFIDDYTGSYSGSGYTAEGYWRSPRDLGKILNMILNLQGLKA